MEENPLFTAEFAVSKEDYKEFMKFMYLKKNIAGSVFRAVFIFLFLYIIIRGMMMQEMLVVMVFGVALFTYSFGMITQYIKLYDRYKSNFGKNCAYSFRDDGFEVYFDNGRSFQRFNKVYETEKYYFFMYSNRVGVFMRKDSLEEDTEKAFRNYIIEKTGVNFKSYVQEKAD